MRLGLWAAQQRLECLISGQGTPHEDHMILGPAAERFQETAHGIEMILVGGPLPDCEDE